MQVVRGVTTPAPLILQLIEAILAVSAVAVELRHREQFVRQIGDQHRVLVGLIGALRLHEGERELVLFIAEQQIAFHRPAHDDHPALAAPALQLEPCLARHPALAGLNPIAVPKQLADKSLHVLGQPELE